MTKGLFSDLDHTLIQPKEGRTFPNSYTDWEFIIPTKEKMLEFHSNGYEIIIVSNQGGIQYGYTTEEELALKFEAIKAKMGIPMTFYYCKTNDKNDKMKKPNIGMAEKAAIDFDIDFENSIMVGDASGLEGQFSDSDKMFAKIAGIGTYYDVLEFQNL